MRKKIVSSAPVRGFIEQTKHTTVPGGGNYTVFELFQAFIHQIRRTSLLERAAAISFNFFMAIPPVLIFVFTLIPYLPISKQFIHELFGIIKDVVPGENNNAVIIGFLTDFLQKPRTGLLSFGLLLAIFFSSNAMMGVLRSFDKNYEGFRHTTSLQKRKTALALTTIMLFTVFTCVILLVAQGAVLKELGIKKHGVRTIISNSRWIVIILLAFLSVSVIYRHGPAKDKRWPLVTAGSVFATTLMILATALVTFWVNNFNNYNKLYGSISAIFILMSLIWVNALVLLLGFELNVTISLLNQNPEDIKLTEARR